MDINWLGHSCFKIKGSRATLITDPYSPETGYTMGKQSAQVVTISHQHPGHNFAEAISDSPRLVTGPGEYEIGGVLIIGMPSFHDAEKGARKGKNTVYIIQIDEITICHLGDLGTPLTSEQVEDMDDIDVLFVPVGGGGSTLDAVAAAGVVRQLEPKIVIPMHYKTEALKRHLQPVDGFLKEMGKADIEPQAKLSVTKASLPLITQVVLLSY